MSSLIDISVLKQRLDVFLVLCKLSQMIVQGLDEGDNSLLQLPGVSARGTISRELNNRIRDAHGSKGGPKLSGLIGLLSIPEQTVSRWINSLVDPENRSQCLSVIKRLPVLSVDFSVTQVPEETASSEHEWFDIRIFIKCEKGDPSCQVYAPRITKAKSLSWWVVVASVRDQILLSARRTELKNNVTSIALRFTVPRAHSKEGLMLHIMSDSMFDLGISVPVVFG